MPENNNSEKLWNYAKVALSLAMGLAYIVIGALVINKKWFMVSLDSNVSLILGVLLIIYGMYRSYRVIKSFL